LIDSLLQQRMSNRAEFILISVCVIGALAFVGVQVFRAESVRRYTPDSTFTEQERLVEFATNGVRVVLFREADSRGLPLLRATFTPTDSGFHLYSKDLDRNSTGGVGMPTQLELLPNPSVKRSGPVFSDVSPVGFPGAEPTTTVEIYPDRPVSLRLPVKFAGDDTDVAAQIGVSWMACKTDGVCLRPVDRQILDVRMSLSRLR
jgi:hypothetical protein